VVKLLDQVAIQQVNPRPFIPLTHVGMIRFPVDLSRLVHLRDRSGRPPRVLTCEYLRSLAAPGARCEGEDALQAVSARRKRGERIPWGATPRRTKPQTSTPP